MNIENIISAWKAEEEHWETPEVACPVGQGLTEEEMLQVSGGACISNTLCLRTNCLATCGTTCPFTCGTAITVPIGTPIA